MHSDLVEIRKIHPLAIPIYFIHGQRHVLLRSAEIAPQIFFNLIIFSTQLDLWHLVKAKTVPDIFVP